MIIQGLFRKNHCADRTHEGNEKYAKYRTVKVNTFCLHLNFLSVGHTK